MTSDQIAADIRGPSPTATRPDRLPNKRTLTAFSNIIAACDHLKKLKTPISVSAVATFTEMQKGGPSHGGLRNNKNFVAFVSARASEQGLTHTEVMTAPEFASTGDPQIDANIAALRAHNQMLRKQVQSMKQMFRNLGQFDLSVAIERGELTLIEGSGAKVSDDVRTAIATLLDPAVLKKCGLDLTPNGQIIRPGGPTTQAILLGRRHVESLRQLITGNLPEAKLLRAPDKP